MGKRSFEEACVVATGVQNFQERFGKKRRYDHDTPPLCQWRCNLTGLSQEHNLFVIACGKSIYVYVPQHPSQALPQQPALIFTSAPSEPGLRGSLDVRNPHSINHLIVEFLGTEEVVAVVRDDGDVDAFLVRHIVQAIERRAEPENSLGVRGDEIKPFFQSNVRISAWGLAIHTEARILAVSSNEHNVSIFKFGLLQEEDESSGSDNEMTLGQDGDDTEEGSFHHRKTDVKHTVINGTTNIPYIAFCNTGDDPEGRWLLTTDISGWCRVMDLNKAEEHKALQTFRFGPTFQSYLGEFDRINAGWIIMFLDRRSFQPANKVHEAVGWPYDFKWPTLHREDNEQDVWDLSRTVDDLPEANTSFVYHYPEIEAEAERRFSEKTQDGDVPNVSMTDAYTDPEEETEQETEESDYSDSSDGGAPLEIEITVEDSAPEETAQPGSTEQEDDPESEDGGLNTGLDAEIEEDMDISAAVEVSISDPDPSSPTWLPENVIDDGEDDEDEGTEDTISYKDIYNGDSIHGNRPISQWNLKHDPNAGPPCPILHASVRNVYLLQRAMISTARYESLPMLGLANPLRQYIQEDFEYLRMFQRLNMVAYIRTLGIVVLASQKGRAIVLQLTKFPHSASPSGSQSGSSSSANKTKYCMRILHILPFAHQEKANQRPFAPLHGIAVGPMQGSEDVEDERKRWRLMMMYQDHSILSYEIGRRKKNSFGGGPGGRDSGVEVEGLVV